MYVGLITCYLKTCMHLCYKKIFAFVHVSLQKNDEDGSFRDFNKNGKRKLVFLTSK